MLEKIEAVAVVTKLHALVPREIYSEKGKTPEDAILQQVPVYDITRQLRRPLLVASVDAAQC